VRDIVENDLKPATERSDTFGTPHHVRFGSSQLMRRTCRTRGRMKPKARRCMATP